jgi:hypothetical protein
MSNNRGIPAGLNNKSLQSEDITQLPRKSDQCVEINPDGRAAVRALPLRQPFLVV